MRKIVMAFLVLAAVQRVHASDGDVARAFFPATLKGTDENPVPVAEQQTVYVRAALDPGGASLIVAGYCNGERGGLAVIAPGDPPAVRSSSVPFGMLGDKISLRLIDMDGDHRPEIIADLDQPRGFTWTWIFRWNDGALRLLGPTDEDDHETTDITNATFVDLDGDGVVEIIDQKAGRTFDENGEAKVNVCYRVAHAGDAAFSDDTKLDFLRLFGRGTGAPPTYKDDFSIEDLGRSRELLLINGVEGSKRVASAKVTVNGRVLVKESDLNAEVERLRVPLPGITVDNHIEVQLRGEPAADVAIIVRPVQN